MPKLSTLGFNLPKDTNGADTIMGTLGGDTIHGGNGKDSIHGGLGNDWLEGGNGNDTIFGDDGNDIIIGGKGADRLSGGFGDGSDTFVFRHGDTGLGVDADHIVTFDGRYDHLDFSDFGMPTSFAYANGGVTMGFVDHGKYVEIVIDQLNGGLHGYNFIVG